MGMFDTVALENVEKFFKEVSWGDKNLPKAVVAHLKESNEFQTKDLGNTLSRYIVTTDGSLKSQHFENYEYESEPTGSVIKGEIKYSGEYWIEEEFHGILDIYDLVDFLNNDWHITFRLKFSDGQLETITLHDIEVVDNAERKSLAIQTKLAQAKREKLLENPIAKLYAGYWVYPMTKALYVKGFQYPKFKKVFNFLAKILIPFKNHF